VHQVTALAILTMMSLTAVALMWRSCKREWLSHHVQEVRSQVKGETPWRKACVVLSNAWHKMVDLVNSGKGFICILLVIALVNAMLAYIGGISGTEWFEASQLKSFLGSMWQVHAAIIGIAVVVVVLVSNHGDDFWKRENAVWRPGDTYSGSETQSPPLPP